MFKILLRRLFCPKDGMVNAKKEKAGKGKPVSWYCPKCGKTLRR